MRATMKSPARFGFLIAIIAHGLTGCVTTVEHSSTTRLPSPQLPKVCALCGAPTIATGAIEDDVSRPSKNLSVWNRSICGNPLYRPDAPICTRCWHAYSPTLKSWSLSLPDPNRFRQPLHTDIAGFPLPDEAGIRTHPVYEQQFDGRHLS